LRVIRKTFFQFPALRLRPVCVCCRHFLGSTVQGVNPTYVFSRNQVAINVNSDLNAAVPRCRPEPAESRRCGAGRERGISEAQQFCSMFQKTLDGTRMLRPQFLRSQLLSNYGWARRLP